MALINYWFLRYWKDLSILDNTTQLFVIIDYFYHVLGFLPIKINPRQIEYNQGVNGGGGGNWTPVRKWSTIRRYILSQCFNWPLDFHRQNSSGLSPSSFKRVCWRKPNTPRSLNDNQSKCETTTKLIVQSIKLQVRNRCQLQSVCFYRGPHTPRYAPYASAPTSKPVRPQVDDSHYVFILTYYQ